MPEFELVHIELGAAGGESDPDSAARSIRLTAPAIAIAIAGSLDLAGAHGGLALGRGQCVYITPDEAELTVRGAGELFLATAARE